MVHESPSVGTATSGGTVSATGDIVGRDKFVFQSAERSSSSPASYLSAVAKEYRSLPRSLKSLGNPSNVTDVFFHVRTDAMRAAISPDATEPLKLISPRYTVLEAVSGIDKMILLGPHGAGKSMGIRVAIQLLARRTNEEGHVSALPFLLDCADDFGTWLLGDDSRSSISQLVDFLYETWGFDLRTIRESNIYPHFMWDHVHVLQHGERLRLFKLIRSINRWFPHARNLVAMRNVMVPEIEVIHDFTAVCLLPLREDENAAVIAKYRDHLAELHSTEDSHDDTAWGTLLSVVGETERESLTLEYVEIVRQVLADDLEAAARILSRLPRLAWRLICSQPGGINYFEALGTLAGGTKIDARTSEVALDALVRCELVSLSAPDRYAIGDRVAVEVFGLRAFEDPTVQQEALTEYSARPGVLDLIERAAQAPHTPALGLAIETALDRIIATNEGDDDSSLLSDANNLRLALLVRDGRISDGSNNARLDLLVERVQEKSRLILDLRIADEISRLVARARYGDSRSVRALRFRRAGPGWATVSIPSGNADSRIDSTLQIEYDLWACETPLTNAQLATLIAGVRTSSDRASQLIDIAKVRPEAWVFREDGVAAEPAFANDPAVGVSYSDALYICDLLTTIARQQVSPEAIIRVPTLGEWGLLDTGLSVNQHRNGPDAGGSFMRPVACGISGGNDEHFSDVYGNVMEWTSTSWGSESLEKPGHSSPYQPNGEWDEPDDAGFHLLRGGSWLFAEGGPKCACVLPAQSQFPDVGVRPVLVLKEGAVKNLANSFELILN